MQRKPSWTVCRQHMQPLWRFLSYGQVPWITFCLHVMNPSFLHLCLISFNCRTPWHNCSPAGQCWECCTVLQNSRETMLSTHTLKMLEFLYIPHLKTTVQGPQACQLECVRLTEWNPNPESDELSRDIHRARNYTQSQHEWLQTNNCWRLFEVTLQSLRATKDTEIKLTFSGYWCGP